MANHREVVRRGHPWGVDFAGFSIHCRVDFAKMTQVMTNDERLLLATLLREREQRRANDPLALFEPHAAQRPFIESVMTGASYENWLFAANRSGKSDAGAHCAATLARYGLPGAAFRPTIGWAVSLDFPSSRDIVQPKLFDNGVTRSISHPPFIPQREIKDWRVADQVLILKNGSVIGFKSADSGRLKFQGAERDYVWFDEEPPMDVYEESTLRVGGGSRLRVFGTCTLLPPEGSAGGVSWSFDRIIKPWQEGRIEARVFQASIYDNPHILAEEIARLEAMYPLGSVSRRIRLNGELLAGLSGARAYTGYNGAINATDDMAPPAYRKPLVWCWDFNVSPVVSLVGQRIGREFRIIREIVMDEGSIEDMCEEFRRLYPAHGAEVYVYGDATGNGRNAQTGVSDYALIQKYMKGYPAPVRLKVPEKNPPVRDRVNAVNRACKTEDGEVLLVVNRSQCPELIRDLEQVLLDPRGGIKKTNDRRDTYFRRTHTSDALGYWISFDEPVVFVGSIGRRSEVRIATPGYSFANRG